ncbi:hypothetical protein PGDDIFCJ_00122 [Thermus phage YS40_Isch]|nr:hypothetical protein PGDDIFCJ_00122 [Thermus phage YS40_Isch]
MSFKVKNIYPYEIDDFALLFYFGYSSEDKPEEELIDSSFVAEFEMLEFKKDDFKYNSKNDTFLLKESSEAIKLFKRFSSHKKRNSQTTFFTKIKGIELKNTNSQVVIYKRQRDYIERLDLGLFSVKINESLNEVLRQAIVRNAIALISENYLVLKPTREEEKQFYYALKASLIFNRAEEVF